MKKRIATGWNALRAIYLVFGVAIIIESATQHKWLGILPGIYLTAMGLFSFNCAAGICCSNDYCTTIPVTKGSESEPGKNK